MTEPLEQYRKYWQYEYDVADQYMIPLLERWGVHIKGSDVIDVGCGEGGGICAMHDRGAQCAGFDIERARVDAAVALLGGRGIPLTTGNLYDAAPPYIDRRFDLVVLHDVFEHLDRKNDLLRVLAEYTKPGGHVMITFPPYYSAYGAHQQLLQFPAARMPFFHLIPFALSQIIPRLKGENPYFVSEVRKLGRLRMGMGSFERIVGTSELRIEASERYLISPNHIRFGLKPVSAGTLGRVPLLREIVCSGVVYLLTRNTHGV